MPANLSRPPVSAHSSKAHLTWLALLLATRLALGTVYNLIVPAWESYDEDGHFAYARYIAVHHSLLKPGDPEAEQVWEKFQPPLYYILVAPLMAGFDLGPSWQKPPANPYFVSGAAGYNYALHPVQPAYAEQQLELAVHAGRMFSVVVSTMGTLFMYLTARLLWPVEKNKVRAVTILYAFWPQFLFIGSMLTNDALVSALAVGVFYLALRLATKGFSWRGVAWLSASLGAAMLTKLNALAFLPVVIWAVWLSLRHTGAKPLFRWLVLSGTGLLIMAILALLNSFQFITQQVFRIQRVADFVRHLTQISQLPEALKYSFRTFAGSFGWGNLETYRWLYPLWAGLAALALLGLVWGILRRQTPLKSGLLGLIGLQALSVAGTSFALFITYENIHLTHGRYLLPTLPAACLLLISGWQGLLPRRAQAYAWKIIGGGIILIGWSIPFTTLAPAYAKPLPATPGRAGTLRPIHAVLGDEIELVGYLPPRPAAAGELLKFSLCWRAMKPITKNYSVILKTVGPDGQGYGELKTYPGRGNYPTSFWTVNALFCDRYDVPVGNGFPAPAVGKIHIGLLDAHSNRWLPITQLAGAASPPAAVMPEANLHLYLPIVKASGQAAPPPNPDPIMIPFKIKPTAGRAVPPANAAEYHFGEVLILHGYDLQPLAGDKPSVQVTLHWEVLKNISENYVVFVHLRDTPTDAYAQDDSEPRGGWYPTGWWEAGEQVLDEHTLHFPEGPAPPLDLYVGLYDRGSDTRVPVFDAHGKPVPNDEVTLAQGLRLP